jgi:hypothetical protein
MKYYIIIFTIFSLNSHAEKLDENQLFYRCYTHLTGKKLKNTHSLRNDVKQGALKATEACVKILEKGQFIPGRW